MKYAVSAMAGNFCLEATMTGSEKTHIQIAMVSNKTNLKTQSCQLTALGFLYLYFP